MIADRPTNYNDAANTAIPPTLPLAYKVYVGADQASAVELTRVTATIDQRVHVSFADGDIPVGSYVCVSAVEEVAAGIDSESVCRGGIFLPPSMPPQVWAIAD